MKYLHFYRDSYISNRAQQSVLITYLHSCIHSNLILKPLFFPNAPLIITNKTKQSLNAISYANS